MGEQRNFVFYPAWREFILKLSSEKDQLQLHRLIMDYGVTGRYDPVGVDPIVLNTFESIIKPQIDRSQRNYIESQNYGKEHGRPKTVNDEKIKQLFKQGLRAEGIAQELGISVTAVYHSDGWKNRKD